MTRGEGLHGVIDPLLAHLLQPQAQGHLELDVPDGVKSACLPAPSLPSILCTVEPRPVRPARLYEVGPGGGGQGLQGQVHQDVGRPGHPVPGAGLVIYGHLNSLEVPTSGRRPL